MPGMHSTVVKLLGSLMVIFTLILAGCGDAKQDAKPAASKASSDSKAAKAAEEQPKEQAPARQAGSFTEQDVELGGIRLGMSYDEVIQLKGKPSKEEKGYAQLISKVIFYGNDAEIGFLNQKVRYVTVTANNGWKTPAGLYAGMTMEEAEKMYGTDYKTVSAPSKRPEESKKSPFYEMRWQGVRYEYRCVPSDVYSNKPGDTSWVMRLTDTNKAKKVDAITIQTITPES